MNQHDPAPDTDDAAHEDGPRDFALALNGDHFARFTRRGPRLLVAFHATFDKDTPISRSESALSALAEEQDWSQLTLTSRGNTWFRDSEVIAFIDALVDNSLLDRFDDTLFYGTGSAAHAALSFALSAPLSRVLALAPQVQIGAEAAAWDKRYPGLRTVDNIDRYLPVPDNLSAAEAVYAAYDPLVTEDTRHMQLLDAGSVMPLVTRRMGSNLEHILLEFGVLDDIVSDAMDGALNRPAFYRHLRARRDNLAYLRSLIGHLIDIDRPVPEALVVRNVAERMQRGRYVRRLAEIEARLAKRGVTLPPSRNRV